MRPCGATESLCHLKQIIGNLMYLHSSQETTRRLVGYVLSVCFKWLRESSSRFLEFGVEAPSWEGLAKRLLASQLFHEMQLTNTPPDEVTFGSSVQQGSMCCIQSSRCTS